MPALGSLPHRLVRLEVASRPVAIVRAAVGAAGILKLAYVAPLLTALARPTTFHMPHSFSPPMPSPAGMLGLLALGLAAALGLLVGWHSRLSGAALTAVLGFVLALDHQLYASHLYLLFLLSFLLTFADSGAALSLDARRRGGRPRIPAWPAVLMMCQLTVVYAFSALAKLNAPYLSGAVLTEALREAGFAALPTAWWIPDRLAPMAWTSIVLELVLACGLWSRRWRRPVAWLGVAFHALIVLTLSPAAELVVFALESLAVYQLFFADFSPGV